MKPILALFIALVPMAAQALAAPITLVDLKRELDKRGVEAVQIAYLKGFPVAAGEFDGQPFFAILRNCALGKEPCGSVRFEACGRPSGLPRSELLEIVNGYNAGFYSGSAFVEPNADLGALACVRLQIEFRDENLFGMDEVFAWQQTIEDFLNFYDERAGISSRSKIMLETE